MKNTDKKSRSRLSGVVAMILATCVVIGLLTSSAIKLASATYLFKDSLKNIPVVGEKLDQLVNNNPVVQTPTQAPVTQAPVQAPATQAPTKAPDTTKAPETESTTSSAELLKQNQSILKNYNDVVNKAKLAGVRPSFTKATYRTVSWDFWEDWFFGFGDVASNNPDYFVSEGDAKAAPTVVPADKVTKELCIPNKSYASILDDENADAVAEAVKSASKEKLADGTIKLTIVLNDESNPTPIKDNARQSESFTSAMFPVVTAEDFRDILDNGEVEEISLTYTDCTVELIYNPATGEIVSLKQTSSYVADFMDGYLPVSAVVKEVSEYYNFAY